MFFYWQCAGNRISLIVRPQLASQRRVEDWSNEIQRTQMHLYHELRHNAWIKMNILYIKMDIDIMNWSKKQTIQTKQKKPWANFFFLLKGKSPMMVILLRGIGGQLGRLIQLTLVSQEVNQIWNNCTQYSGESGTRTRTLDPWWVPDWCIIQHDQTAPQFISPFICQYSTIALTGFSQVIFSTL